MASSLYQPLVSSRSDVRMVQLLPKSADAVIRCQLVHQCLDDDPEYEAISYAWGHSIQGYRIQLDGQDFPTTDNLYDALSRLQSPTDERVLWIDQICINQADLVERGRQVKLMNLVYTKATRALLWIGEEAYLHPSEVPSDQFLVPRTRPCEWVLNKDGYFKPECDETSPQIGLVDVASDYIFQAFQLVADLANAVEPNEIACLLSDAEHEKNIIRALWFILHRPWWSRVWTVQECLLPQQSLLMYGPVSAPFSMFLRASELYASRSMIATNIYPAATAQTLRNFEQTLRDINRFHRSKVKSALDLVSILRCFRTREAKDERDKIFGFLGLNIDWHGEEPVKPDYTTSINQIYQETVLKIINGTKSLRIWINNLDENRDRRRTTKQHTQPPGPAAIPLPASASQDLRDLLSQIDTWKTEFSQAPYFIDLDHTVHNLPSFVPDWSATTNFAILPRYDLFDHYNAASNTQATIIHNLSNQNTLSVKGIPVDTVRWTSQIMAFNDGPFRSNLFKDWLDFSADASAYPARCTAAINATDAFWRVICGDCVSVSGSGLESTSTTLGFQRLSHHDSDLFVQWCEMYEPDLLPNFSPFPTGTDFENISHNDGDDDGDGAEGDIIDSPDRHDEHDISQVIPSVISLSGSGSGSGSVPGRFSSLELSIRASTTMRRMFITRKGYLGLGPAGMVGGEKIFVFYGGQAPFVLRPELECGVEIAGVGIGAGNAGDQTEPNYRLVGDCYVHGMMDGEVFNLGLKDEMVLLV